MKNASSATNIPDSFEKALQENTSQLEEEELQNLKDQLSKLSTEKELLAQQYQQYILRLNGQIRTINSQVCH